MCVKGRVPSQGGPRTQSTFESVADLASISPVDLVTVVLLGVVRGGDHDPRSGSELMYSSSNKGCGYNLCIQDANKAIGRGLGRVVPSRG